MNNENNFETYLIINSDHFWISVIQIDNNEVIYNDKKLINDFSKKLNLNLLDEFMKKNVFIIEKKIGSFLNNIFLIIDFEEFFPLNISIKKNYSGESITLESLNYLLNEIKKDCNKTILKKKIVHMIIENYFIDKKKYSYLPENLICDSLILDINFLCLSDEYIKNLERVFKKYQILISKIFSASYIRTLFPQNEHDLVKMAKQVKEGYNANEVVLVKKKQEKHGFFERFFDFFR